MRWIVFLGGSIYFFLVKPTTGIAEDLFFPSYRVLQKTLSSYVENSSNRVFLVTRTMNDRDFAETLISARKRGVDVKLLLGPLRKETKGATSVLNMLTVNDILFKFDRDLRVETTAALLFDDRLYWVKTLLGDQASHSPLILESIENRRKVEAFKRYFDTHWGQLDSSSLAQLEWDQLPSVYNYKTQKKVRADPHLTKKLPKNLKSELRE